jgi:hypothetical protein
MKVKAFSKRLEDINTNLDKHMTQYVKFSFSINLFSDICILLLLDFGSFNWTILEYFHIYSGKFINVKCP